jgi:hypothetical protein
MAAMRQLGMRWDENTQKVDSCTNRCAFGSAPFPIAICDIEKEPSREQQRKYEIQPLHFTPALSPASRVSKAKLEIFWRKGPGRTVIGPFNLFPSRALGHSENLAINFL